MSQFFLYSGVASLVYSVYAGLRYYSLTGKGLITSNQAKKMIRDGSIKTVIDVRTTIEWNRGHYKDAKHIPVAQLTSSKLKGLSKDDGILVYCNTGQRARRAAEIIRDFGFINVYYIEGGWWTLSPGKS